MRWISGLAGALLSVCGGCVSLPEFDKSSDVTPGVIVDVVHCELIAARKKFPRLAGTGTKPPEKWVAVAEMFLQVDEQATLTPSFTHTFSKVFDWGLKLDTQVQRTYTETVQYSVGDLQDTKCSDLETSGRSLTGKLGIVELVDMAFESIDGTDIKDRGVALQENKAGQSFGGLIQFVVTKNVNGIGPTWTLAHFKGPGKMFGAQRVDTHKLTIGFAKAKDTKTAASNAREVNKSLQINQLQQRLN